MSLKYDLCFNKGQKPYSFFFLHLSKNIATLISVCIGSIRWWILTFLFYKKISIDKYNWFQCQKLNMVDFYSFSLLWSIGAFRYLWEHSCAINQVSNQMYIFEKMQLRLRLAPNVTNPCIWSRRVAAPLTIVFCNICRWMDVHNVPYLSLDDLQNQCKKLVKSNPHRHIHPNWVWLFFLCDIGWFMTKLVKITFGNVFLIAQILKCVFYLSTLSNKTQVKCAWIRVNRSTSI